MALQGYNTYTYNNLFKRGEFHHVVLSVSGNIHSLYLDGSMVAQNKIGNIFSLFPLISNTVIGANSSLNNAFKGNIDDVRVYNKALLPTQVSDLYINRNLVIYYPFDNLVNKRTPNYATLQYDASFIGQSSITSNAFNGNGALSVSNTQGVAATQYVYSRLYPQSAIGNTSWKLNANNGLTIGCWINTNGIANRIQRIFDIPIVTGQQGLAVDISGTNMIYSSLSYRLPAINDQLVVYYPFTLDASCVNYVTKIRDISLVGITISNETFYSPYASSIFINNPATGTTTSLGIVRLYNKGFIYYNKRELTFSAWIRFKKINSYNSIFNINCNRGYSGSSYLYNGDYYYFVDGLQFGIQNYNNPGPNTSFGSPFIQWYNTNTNNRKFTEPSVTPDISLTINNWYRYTVIVTESGSNTNFQIYINDMSKNYTVSTPLSGDFTSDISMNIATIGGQNNSVINDIGGNSNLCGVNINDLRLYNRALSREEAMSLYYQTG